MLTPEQIDRVRDLIALGPLTAENGDPELMELGFIVAYFPIWRGSKPPEVAQHLQVAINRRNYLRGTAYFEKTKHPVLVDAHPKARKKFYNRDGGVKKEHWCDGTDRTFVEHMRGAA